MIIARTHEEPGQPLELDFTKWMIAVFTFAFATQEEIIERSYSLIVSSLTNGMSCNCDILVCIDRNI
jgi:hypothetical protein